MKVRFMLQVYEDDRLDRAFILPPVSSYDVSRDEASQLTWTLGAEPEREHTGVRETRILLRGTSGYGPRAARTANGGEAFITGKEHVEAFEEFLGRYQEDSQAAEGRQVVASGAAARTQPRRIHMVFLALDYGHAYLVEPSSIRRSKSVDQHNFTTGWELSLRAYATEEVLPTGLLASAVTRARAATAFINSANAYLAQTELLLSDLRYSLEEFKEPIRALGRTVLAVLDAMDELRGVVTFPFAMAAEISRVAANSRASIIAKWESLPQAHRGASRDTIMRLLAPIGDTQRRADELLGVAGAGRGEGGDVPFASWMAPPAELPPDAAVVSYIVPAGVTLRDIAEELLGSGDWWKLIADLNGMTSATMMNDGSPFRPGITILVPSLPGGGGQGDGAEMSGDGDPYGSDVLLKDGDWALDGAEATDVRWVRGPANLRQGITTRFATVQGECGPFPALGLPKLVGEDIGNEAAALVAAHARRQALRDPRIAKVERIEVTDEGDAITADLHLVAHHGGRIQLMAPVPKPGNR